MEIPDCRVLAHGTSDLLVEIGVMSFDGIQLLVDGHNNAGSSGGPVVFKPMGNEKDVWKIAGAVYAYQIEDIAYFTESCHPFHVKAATRNAAKLPPPGA